MASSLRSAGRDSVACSTNCKAWLFQILFNVVRHERRNWFKRITGKEEDLRKHSSSRQRRFRRV